MVSVAQLNDVAHLPFILFPLFLIVFYLFIYLFVFWLFVLEAFLLFRLRWIFFFSLRYLIA